MVDPRETTAALTRRAWLWGACLAVAVATVAPSLALADDGWWRPREDGGRGRGRGRGRGGDNRSAPPAPWGGSGWGGDSYAPPRCAWVEISRQPIRQDASGQTVYLIRQRDTCTGKTREIYGY